MDYSPPRLALPDLHVIAGLPVEEVRKPFAKLALLNVVDRGVDDRLLQRQSGWVSGGGQEVVGRPDELPGSLAQSHRTVASEAASFQPS